MTVPGEPSDPVEAAWRACQAARPGVALSLDRFRAHLAAHRPAELTLDEQLATWCLDDAYLAAAATAGDPVAVRAIADELVPIIDLALSTWEPAVRDETRQRLHAMLVVDHGGRGPLLGQYGGRGALRRWIRVVAVREAGKTRTADQAALPVDDQDLLDALAPASDPALSAVKREAAAAFKAAFLAAVASLEPRERTALRLHLLDGLTIDDIAPMFEVHRATVARWIGGARQAVLERTRRGLMRDLRIDAADADSLIRLVQSRIELSGDELATRR